MQTIKKIYQGKAKTLYTTANPNEVIIRYRDSATAGNGVKKETIIGKGKLNNEFATIIYKMLNAKKIPTHFIKQLNATDQLCKKVKIIPLEVIIRNIAAGSMAKRLGLHEGLKLKKVVFELSYKDDILGDPLMNNDHAVAMGIVSEQQLKNIQNYALKINQILIDFFKKVNIKLIDFKLEFGLFKGKILLADEISPDTCRLWDMKTNEKLDKDVFRRDLGDLITTYKKVLAKIS
ncbi:MAG: phosphoribosylaminoimidazolesuccinocarboxamide synthase [Mycoplasmataceae bacterium]|nr:phosphoribosylaminoimidazolesuccinocarboxamide synthase [Mycoplasmataceae bacterium]